MTNPRRYSDDHIISLVQTWDRRLPEALSMDRFCRETGVGSTTIQRRFGGWLPLRVKAGLQRRRSHLINGRMHSAESLLKQLQSAVKKYGRFITQAEFCQWAEVSANTIRAYCGSWRKLKAAAGLPERRRRQRLYEDRELLDEVHRLIGELGRWPTSEEVNRHGRFSYATYAERFGGMQGVVRAMEQELEALKREWARRQSAKLQATPDESPSHPPR